MLTHHLWEYDLLFHLNFSIILFTFVHIFYTYMHFHSYLLYFLSLNSLFFYLVKNQNKYEFDVKSFLKKIIEKEAQPAIKEKNINIYKLKVNKRKNSKKIMSQYSIPKQQQIRLNVINKQNENLKISIIVGGSLTMSHLKRKIETQFNQLYGIQLVIKVIEDKNGFIISNNSNVQEHFRTGDTIYFQEHRGGEKNGSNMNMASNLGEILSTVKFMTASALQKMDKIDLTNSNVMELIPDLLHLGFWFSNPSIVQKLYKILNKIFGQSSIQKFLNDASEIQVSILLRNFTFWLTQIPNSVVTNPQISWQLIQLIEKFTFNQKFSQIIKNHKLSKCILQISKQSTVSHELKKTCVRIMKNLNGGLSRGNGLHKIKSQYIPSMLGSSTVNGYGIEDILGLMISGSPDEKLTALQYLAENNFEAISEATVRSDYYEKFTSIFSIRKLKTKKHMTFFNQAINQLTNQTTKDQCIQIIQRDILKKIHSFMLESPVETHPVCIEYLSKICKNSSNSGMFNLQKSVQYLKSPYPQFQKLIINSTLIMSEKLSNISSIRFIPGIKDYVTLSLKTTSEQMCLDLLKILSNLCLDEQCRYQILNLRGIQVLVKFLETSKNQQICRASAKGLLNLTISSRENKAKVIGAMTNIIQRFYRMEFDSVSHGYIDTILKSKNM